MFPFVKDIVCLWQKCADIVFCLFLTWQCQLQWDFCCTMMYIIWQLFCLFCFCFWSVNWCIQKRMCSWFGLLLSSSSCCCCFFLFFSFCNWNKDVGKVCKFTTPFLLVIYLYLFLSEVTHTEKQVAPKAAFSRQFFRLLSIMILLGSQKLSFLALVIVKACIVSTINKWCHDVLFEHSGTLCPLLRCAVFHFQERTLFFLKNRHVLEPFCFLFKYLFWWRVDLSHGLSAKYYPDCILLQQAEHLQ